MDCARTGALIRKLRLEKGLTQARLAQMLGVGDKAVSKWERGEGCPDVSLLKELSSALGVSLNGLLRGELEERRPLPGDIRRLGFYVCPHCANIISAMGGAEIYCCSKRLSALTPVRAAEGQELDVELMNGEYRISSRHPMAKEEYISFLALVTADGLNLIKLYPEWDLDIYIPYRRRGTLVWYSTKLGLMWQPA